MLNAILGGCVRYKRKQMKIMRRNVLLFMFALLVSLGAMAQVAFVGNSKYKVWEEKPVASTGLNKLYVLRGAGDYAMQYTAKSAGAKVVWYTFGATGGAYAKELDGVKFDGKVSVLNKIVPNTGYIIEEGNDRLYLWVVDYADYELTLGALTVADEADCGVATLNVEGQGDDISYYTINGGRKTLDRKLRLSYRNLVWNEDDLSWTQQEQVEELQGLKKVISVMAPYCDTEFALSGDRFLEYWGERQSVVSGVFRTKSVAVQTTAVQEKVNAENQKGGEDDSLGGSAPATITFSAYCTDAVSQKEWQKSVDPEFNEIEESFNDDEVRVVIEEAGTSYWRFVGKNATGECDAYGDVYQINISESSLQCPNAFSPGVTEGVNDEWKVSYKSLVKFKCWIFNSWGVQMCELTDPSQGWDGTYGGKVVKPGVYYYVIEAEGSEGKRYKKRGDINVVGMKGEGSGTSTDGE